MELFTKRRVKLRPVPTQRGLEETELMLGKKKKISAKGKIKSNSETRNIKAVDDQNHKNAEEISPESRSFSAR